MKILMVSKPLRPPWDDSAKNLPRDIALNCPEIRFNLMTYGRFSLGRPNLRMEPVYGLTENYDPGFHHQFKVFLRLLQPDELGLYHFFFTPNPKSSMMCKLAMAMKGFQKSVQTVCSAPENYDKIKSLLFSDIVVALSDDTANRLKQAQVPQVRRIYPAVELPEEGSIVDKKETRRKLGLPEEAVLALYAGDLEFSDAASVLIEALPEAAAYPGLHIVFCNRMKTPKAVRIRKKLQKRVEDAGLKGRVSWLDAQESMSPLLLACDIMLMHPDTLYAKMDIPLVLLEAMARGLPSIISNLASLEEAFAGEKAGIAIEPSAPQALASALIALAEDAALCESCGKAARQVCAERFSMSALAEAHRALYREFE